MSKTMKPLMKGKNTLRRRTIFNVAPSTSNNNTMILFNLPPGQTTRHTLNRGNRTQNSAKIPHMYKIIEIHDLSPPKSARFLSSTRENEKIKIKTPPLESSIVTMSTSIKTKPPWQATRTIWNSRNKRIQSSLEKSDIGRVRRRVKKQNNLHKKITVNFLNGQFRMNKAWQKTKTRMRKNTMKVRKSSSSTRKEREKTNEWAYWNSSPPV